jgi:hypothetical protein
LLDKLNTATSVERTLVENPFRLEKVAGSLRKKCAEHSITNKFKQSFITIDGATFNTKHLINAFEAVGSRARGYIASNPGIFFGRSYIIVEPDGFEYGKGVRAILLQSGRCSG